MPGIRTTLCALSLLLLATAPAGALEQRFEDFSSDPGWDGNNNRSTDPACMTTTQAFGYSAGTSNAGGSAGEIGGSIQRAADIAYYADTIAASGFDSTLSASGKLAVTGANGGGAIIGFFVVPLLFF